jgi:opacity protein-like surface antigen
MRVRHGVSLLLAAAATLGAAASARAQHLDEPRARQGYFVAAGLHAAVTMNNNDGDELGPWTGYGTTIRVGQMLTPRLGLGLNLDIAGAKGDGQTASIVGLGVAGQVEVVRNLALHAGIGFGVTSIDNPELDELDGGYGAAYSLALTYDWFMGHRLSGGWAITPGIRARAMPSDTIDSFTVLAGVEISYWSGLPRNQLSLPENEAYKGD